MKKYIYCLGIIVSFLFPAGVSAQHSFGYYISGSLPQNQFRQLGYNKGIGMAMEYSSPSLLKISKKLQMRLGAGFEYISYGRSNSVERPATGENLYFTNDMNALYMAPKFEFTASKKFTPYFDIVGSAKNFNSWQITYLAENTSQYSSRHILSNTAFHYGASLGFMYNISKHVSFDIRMSYTKGGAVNFTQLSSPHAMPENTNLIAYSNKYSTASDILTFRLGMMINLHRCEICKKYNCTAR